VTDSPKARGDDYENLLKDLEITEPYWVFSSNISNVRTTESSEHHCQIRDLASGIALAHKMSDHIEAELVVDTIEQAVGRYRLPEDCIFHSNLGS